MTKVAFQKLVEEAAQLQSEIAEKSRRLETVKAQIAAEIAKQPKVETTATDGGGQTFRVESKSGVGIRVTQPAPQLIRSFSPELIEKIKALAGRSFGKLFVVKYSTVPGKVPGCGQR